MENDKFYSILTEKGKEKIAQAILSGNKINLTEMAVGDAGGVCYQPTEDMDSLKNEVWRGKIAYYQISEEDAKKILIGMVIPTEVGGFYIREMGVFDETGDLIAICNTPETQKVSLDEVVNQMDVALEIVTVNRDAIAVKIDENIVTATKKELNAVIVKVDNHLTDVENPHQVTANQIPYQSPSGEHSVQSVLDSIQKISKEEIDLILDGLAIEEDESELFQEQSSALPEEMEVISEEDILDVLNH